jgi:HD superfamily phosphodiesterase
MDLTRQIKSAEKQFKQILEGYFASIYNEKILPSHGLNHHRRVWLNACDLITDGFIKNTITDSGFPFSLIIACYLHDLGICVEQGPDHGKHSCLLCREFMNLYDLRESDYPGLLEAIERHDEKEYVLNPDRSFLNIILSVADDLDAFGITGIYRYAEIYSARGIKNEMLAVKIRENARRRFNHFRHEFGNSGPLFLKHLERYQLLDSFYMEFEKELSFGKLQPGHLSGRTGVIELIKRSLEQQKDFDELIFSGLRAEDGDIRDFFFNLQKENTCC